MSSLCKRLLFVLLPTLIFLGIQGIPARAQTEPPPVRTTADNCVSCHADVFSAWHLGGHGDARANAALSQAGNCMACHKEIPTGTMSDTNPADATYSSFWVDQGQPNDCLRCHVTGLDPETRTWKADGITCEACHRPIPASHPKEPMPVDKNAELCSNCHTDARFDWSTWQDSVHYQKDMHCMDCHDPHTTSLKLISQKDEDGSALCENCHEEIAQAAPHSTHAKAGATCVTCHLGPAKGKDDFHQVPDHDFEPKLEACNTCHAEQMHAAGSATAILTATVIPPTLAITNVTPTVETTTKQEPEVTTEHPVAKPVEFIVVGAVMGLVVGISWRRRSLPPK